MVKLREKPFYLDDEGVKWVEETLQRMTLEEKVGQLFCEVVWSSEDAEIERIFSRIKPGGTMVNSRMKMEETIKVANACQRHSDIPMLIAANLERGGNGATCDGTYFSTPLGVAATDNEQNAYRLGYVAGKEGKAVGINWSYEPLLDIHDNPLSAVLNTRTFGNNPDRIIRMASAYMRGCYDAGCAVSIKHWPGDGQDFRDQHLVSSVNTKSVEDWEATYGKIYRSVIDAGADTLMAAHIRLPSYSRALNPSLKDEEILPGSLSYELTTTLLREKMGFNGMVITDASEMVGFTVFMPRSKAVPACIAAGCDMLMFTIISQEDVDYMFKGIEDGIITPERLDEAVTRILALKASIGLHKPQKLASAEEARKVLKDPQHLEWAKICADEAVTLVKDRDHLLPLTPEKYKRILLRVLTNSPVPENQHDENTLLFRDLLAARGFTVTDYTEGDQPGGLINEGTVEEMKSRYDLVLYIVNTGRQGVRIQWTGFLGGDCPKFVKDIPTVMVSLENAFFLMDAPMVSTYINAYTPTEIVVQEIVKKLTGESPFKGVDPVDSFCGMWDTRL